MKRWQSKREKWMIGGLFFLLMISSFPWVNYNEVGTGTANLAQKTPPSDKKKRDSDSKRDDKLEYHIEKNSNRNYKVTLRRKKNNDVEARIIPTEGSIDCNGNCEVIGTTYTDVKQLEDLKKTIDELVEEHDKKIVASRKGKEDKKDGKKSRKGKKNEEVEEEVAEEDAIEEACHSHDAGDTSFTYCAMKELGRLAERKENKKKGTKKVSANEMYELFKNHIYDNLKDLMSSDDEIAQDEARNNVDSLLKKLSNKDHREIRNDLAALVKAPFLKSFREASALLTQAKLLEKSNPVAGMELLNQYSIERTLLSNRMREELERTYDIYDALKSKGLSNSFGEFNQLYERPLHSLAQDLLSGNQVASLNGQYGPPILDNQSRAARGGVSSGFPPSQNRGGPQGNRYGPPPAGTGFNGLNSNGGRFNRSQQPGTQLPGGWNPQQQQQFGPSNNIGRFGPQQFNGNGAMAPNYRQPIYGGQYYGYAPQQQQPFQQNPVAPGVYPNNANRFNYGYNLAYPQQNFQAPYNPGINGPYTPMQPGVPMGVGGSGARPRF